MMRKCFDLRSGVIAALLMGAIVWRINAAHGPLLATTAALKQGAYTFLMGGLIVQFCTTLARRRSSPGWAIASAVLLPAIVTIAATFLVHSLKGTPEPTLSTIPVALIAPPSFLGLAVKARRDLARSDEVPG